MAVSLPEFEKLKSRQVDVRLAAEAAGDDALAMCSPSRCHILRQQATVCQAQRATQSEHHLAEP
eukprot:6475458-Prymnesium_polylepis.1